MKKYVRSNLNIKHLLSLGDLDIRGIAAKNQMITADEYFSKVENFIENASQLWAVLQEVADLQETVNALKNLEIRLGVDQHAVDLSGDTKRLAEIRKVKDVLTEIGYTKLNSDLDKICESIKTDDLQRTEKLASMVLVEFRQFYEQTKSAYSVKRFLKSKDTNTPAAESYSTVLLKEALEYLDYEETHRKMRILAVDDVTVVLNAIVSVLSPYYEVYALKSSSLVEKFLSQITPELFLLDIEMGGINGFDLVPLIRKFEKHKDTPIVFLTGNASLNNLKDALALGACDFLSKPIDKDILIEKINKNIIRKKAY